MQTPYWSSLLNNRTRGRRGLASARAPAAGAAILAACGGGSDKASSPEEHGQLLSRSGDESNNATRGAVSKTIGTRHSSGVMEPPNTGTGALSVVANTY